MWPLIIVGVLVVLIVLWAVATYNRLVAYRLEAQNTWSHIDVQLKRRYDLIPNLVETVKGYARHERETLENVVRARQQAIDARSVKDQAAAENLLTGALRQLFALAEAYPDLKANQNFLQLQQELGHTEDQVGSARQGYNNAVTRYNTALQVFPANLVANMFDFNERDFFEIEAPQQREAPKVQF